MRKYYILLLFIGLTQGLFGQSQVIYRDQASQSYVFKAGPEAGSIQNQLLALLAEARGARPGSSAELIMNLDIEKRIVRDNSKQLTASVYIKNIRIEGRNLLRGFSLDDVLYPSSVKFRYTVQDGLPLNRALIFDAELPLRDRAAGPSESRFQDSSGINFRLDVSQLKFSFVQKDLDAFKNRVAIIHDYYASEQSLRLAFDKLNRVEPSDVDRIDLHAAALKDVEQLVNTLERKDFDSKLELNEYDPIRFLPAMYELRTAVSAKKMAIEQVMSTLHLHYYHAGLDMLARNRRQAARDAFKRSLYFLPYFAPSAYQLARMDYQDGYIYEAECRIVEIMQHMDPDPDTRYLTVELSARVYDSYLQESEQLIARADFERAVDYLMKAKNLCNAVRGLVCDERLSRAFRNARKGWYDSYLDQARTAYSEGNLDQAEKLVKKALAMHEQYASDIQSDAEAKSMLLAIRQKRYEFLLGSVRKGIQAGNYSIAKADFDKARSMQRQYGLITSDEQLDLGRSAVRPIAVNMAREAENRANGNDLSGARKMASDIRSMQNDYSLNGDAQVEAALAGLLQKIFSRECELAQITFNSKMNDARVAMAAVDYLRAKVFLEAARKISQDNYECGIRTDELEASYDSILPAATYQLLIQKILDLQTQRNFSEAIGKYGEAGPYFHQFNLKGFGLEHKSLKEFAMARGNHAFLIFLSGRSIDAKQYEDALDYFRELSARKQNPKSYKKELIRLGEELGRRDKMVGNQNDRKTGAARYLSKEQGLKFLNKGYKKGWK